MNDNLKHFFLGIPALPSLALAFLALGSAPPAAHAAPPAYAVTDLGVLPGGTSSDGLGVNDSGQVTGSSNIPDNSRFGFDNRAFLSGPGGTLPLKNLGTLGSIGGYTGSFGSDGDAVNASGQVAGTSSATNGTSVGRAAGHALSLAVSAGRPALRSAVGTGHPALKTAGALLAAYHAFLSGPNGGPLQDLGTLGGNFSEAYGVNDSGQVTGQSSTGNFDTSNLPISHAFLSGPNGGALKDLGTLPGDTDSIGYAVNASGQVSGESASHAFLSGPNGGALKDLGTLPGGTFSEGRGVNAGGQVTGDSYTSNGNNGSSRHAFLSGPNGGPLQDLGTLAGGSSQGDGVNDSGQVVGTSDGSAFLYSSGVMTDLNTLIPAGSGLTLEEATHISNNGFITGYGTASNGQAHAFLLTPIPVNSGPIITVTAIASTADAVTRQRTVNVTTTNTGGAAADMLTLTSVTLGGVPPAPAPISPSPVPTTPNNLSNLPGINTQQNGFVFAPSPGTTRAVLNVAGQYTNPNTGITSAFKTTIRLTLP